MTTEAIDVWTYGEEKAIDVIAENAITIRYVDTRPATDESGKVTEYAIMKGEERIGRLYNHSLPSAVPPWHATIDGDYNCTAWEFDATPEAAVHGALTNGIRHIEEELEKIKATAVHFGDDMIAVAEGMPA